MGTISIGDALFSSVQQRVLGLLFASPDKSYYLNQLASLAGSGKGALSRELERLVGSGLVTVECIGRMKHFKANPASPIFSELCGIALKTFGFVDVLRNALTPLASHIIWAFVFGSVANGTAHASSDVDVLIVANDLKYPDLFEALSSAEQTLQRKISPALYSKADFLEKSTNNHFLRNVLSGPVLNVIGDGHAV